MSTALPYTAIWVLDFEFIALKGEHPVVVCLVAHDLVSGEWVRVWQGGFSSPPFSLGPESLFVGYAAAAEWSCFIALGWPMPARCLDLFAEFRRISNGASEERRMPSLLAVAAHLGITTTDADHKGAMRELILSGGPWSDAERRDILDYCAADVRMTAEVFQALRPHLCGDWSTLGGALFRGRYTSAVARMEWNGVPIDTEILGYLSEDWEHIKHDLIADIDREYGVYDGTRFVESRFETYLTRAQIPWPRTAHGRLELRDDTFADMARGYPALAPLRELRRTLSQLRLNELSVGRDGRNRTGLMPFASKTGRNQPSNSRFIFGAARWLRGLIKPGPGKAVAYIDWVSQEIAIAAALSGDAALWEAYISGDPYMAFALQAGLAPPGATKATHKAVRQRAKSIMLGVGYGMSAASIAIQANLHVDEARELLSRHKATYHRFWAWAENNQNAGLMSTPLQTVFSWTWRAGQGTTPNPRSLLNWPMQANGAEMMRLACCELTERGICVCCPVHDALLIEADAENIQQAVRTTRAVMEHASEVVLGEGRVVRTDADVFCYPARFADEAGGGMWERVMALLRARGRPC